MALMIPPPPLEAITAPVPAIIWNCIIARQDGTKAHLSGRFGNIDASPDHPVAAGAPEFEVTSDDTGRFLGKHPTGTFTSGNYLNYVEKSDVIYSLGFHFPPSADRGSVEIASWPRAHAEAMRHEFGSCTVTPEAHAERGQ
jgi:hypothetical protein